MQIEIQNVYRDKASLCDQWGHFVFWITKEKFQDAIL